VYLGVGLLPPLQVCPVCGCAVSPVQIACTRGAVRTRVVFSTYKKYYCLVRVSSRRSPLVATVVHLPTSCSGPRPGSCAVGVT
jgi:hypothetical protein